MQKNWLKPLAVAALLATGGAAQASVIHDDAFVDGSGTNNGTVNYRSAGSFTVEFTAAQAGTAAISFDLFGARSTDGDNFWKDVYAFALNGVTLFEGTFNLGGGGGDVVYTNEGLTYAATTPGGWQGGTVAVSGMVDLIPGLNQFTFSFTSPSDGFAGPQGLDDEGWGVNRFDVEVAPVPLPAAMPLLAGAIAGLGALGLRRRKGARV